MRHPAFNRILVFLSLLTFLFSGNAAQAWYCDGRLCSVATVCCCQSPVPQQDRKCSARAEKVRIESSCGADCKCKLVVSERITRHTTIPAYDLLFSAFAVLPALPRIEYAAPCASEQVLLHIETRGPPRSPLNLRTPSLRAPPIA